jgi:hypothetical protein
MEGERLDGSHVIPMEALVGLHLFEVGLGDNVGQV